jgi:creatinine amidohydrolase
MNPPLLRSRFWSDLTSEEFSRLDRERMIAVLPVGAIEQHGPHLPMSVDTTILEGVIERVAAQLPDDLPVLFLPTQRIGKSNEHSRYPGTLTLSAADADQPVDGDRRLRGCGRRAQAGALQQPRRPGMRGDIVARDLRVKHDMLVVADQHLHLRHAARLVQRAASTARHPRRRQGDLGHAGAAA